MGPAAQAMGEADQVPTAACNHTAQSGLTGLPEPTTTVMASALRMELLQTRSEVRD